MSWPMVHLTAILVLLGASVARPDDSPQALAPQLKPFTPCLDQTFKGEFVGSTPERPMYDVARWERALNGKAVRVLHSVNDGQYGGETIIMWDEEKEALVYWYFTTAGFHTQGTIATKDHQWTTHETVAGNANGITEVKSTSQLLPDGRLHTKSQYLRDGEWVSGHEVYYEKAPDAKVVFK